MTTQLLLTFCLLAVAYVNGQASNCLDCETKDKCVLPHNTVTLTDRPNLDSKLNITCDNGKVTLTFDGHPDSKLVKFETVERNGKKCSASGTPGNLDTTLTGDYHDCLTGGFKKNDEDTCLRAWTNVSITQRVPNGNTGLDLVLYHKIQASCCMKVDIPTLVIPPDDPLDLNATACEHFYFDVDTLDVGCDAYGWQVTPRPDQFANFYPISSPNTNWYVDSCYAKGSGPEEALLVTNAVLSKSFVYMIPKPQAVGIPTCDAFFLDPANAGKTECPYQQLAGERTITSDPRSDLYDFSVPEFAINGNANYKNHLNIHCTMKICSTVDPNENVFLKEYFGNIQTENILCDKKFNQATGALLSEVRSQIRNTATL